MVMTDTGVRRPKDPTEKQDENWDQFDERFDDECEQLKQ